AGDAGAERDSDAACFAFEAGGLGFAISGSVGIVFYVHRQHDPSFYVFLDLGAFPTWQVACRADHLACFDVDDAGRGNADTGNEMIFLEILNQTNQCVKYFGGAVRGGNSFRFRSELQIMNERSQDFRAAQVYPESGHLGLEHLIETALLVPVRRIHRSSEFTTCSRHALSAVGPATLNTTELTKVGRSFQNKFIEWDWL